MNERLRSVLVIVTLVIALAVSYEFFLKPYAVQERAVNQVLFARSTWNITLQEYTINGAISSQTYRVTNDDGKVKMFYSATSRNGLVTKQFDVPLSGPTATFLFEDLRANGIWELEDKPLRPHPRDEYIIFVAQTLGSQGGNRAFGFSDPHYWATTNAREFMLLPLNPHSKPTAEATTTVGSRSLREPRYLKIVESIKAFGPDSVQQAESKIRAELIEADRGTAAAARP
jgi:hypothetical protein